MLSPDKAVVAVAVWHIHEVRVDVFLSAGISLFHWVLPPALTVCASTVTLGPVQVFLAPFLVYGLETVVFVAVVAFFLIWMFVDFIAPFFLPFESSLM
jgi:hypothetical protein